MKRRIFPFLMAAFILAGLLTGCSVRAETPGAEQAQNNGAAQTSGDSGSAVPESPDGSGVDAGAIKEKLKAEDTDSSWEDESSTKIFLSGAAADISGDGASASGGAVTITEAGTYIVSGTLSKGQILINAGKKDTVRLVLNGASITADTNAAIYAASADKLIITLAEGTENRVTDAGAAFAYADVSAEEPDAALFSKCDLSFNGSGSLTVNAGFYNGIGTKDDLVVAGGVYTVSAANNGLRGRDSVTVLNGVFDITAGNDGIQSNNDEDTSKGWIYLEDGEVTVTAAHDAVQAETDLIVLGGSYTFLTGGAAPSESSDSYKGLKAAGAVTIGGGSFVIDSADDCIHANGNVSISGGDFTLSSGDDGIHSDADTAVSGGNINILKSYEGIEGANVTITGGSISIAASDDGINAAGGNDGGAGGHFGRDQFMQAGNYSINVGGGDVTLVAGGDGFDSNGSINITGGTVVSLISSSADNGAMDCDGTYTVTGGTLIYGGTGIGQVPGGGSAQSYVYIDGGISAGSEVTLKKDGESLISFTPAIECRYLAFSSPDIVNGQSYELYAGTDSPVDVTAGTGGRGGAGGMGGPGDRQGGRQGGGQGGFPDGRPDGVQPQPFYR